MADNAFLNNESPNTSFLGIPTTTDTSTNVTSFNLAGQNPLSKLFQKPTSKDDLKNSQKEDIVVKTVDVYPTVASGDSPTAPNFDWSSEGADFYRHGELNVDRTVHSYPRTIEPFEDEGEASIRVYGTPVGETEARDLIPTYTKFILDSVQESSTERSQIVETFGDFYVFMFGKRPSIYNFSGTLINSKNASWVTDFMYMYDRYLRGSQCVASNAVAIITYGGRQVEGLILNTANQTAASTEPGVPFQFSVVVFERKYYNFSRDMGISMNDNEEWQIDENFINTLEKVAGKTGGGSSTSEVSDGFNAANSVLRDNQPPTGPLPIFQPPVAPT